MNFRNITDKLKDTIIPKEDKKEELETTQNDKNVTAKDDIMEYEQKPISDEIEFYQEQPMKIKTVFVKSEDEEDEDNKKIKTIGAVKIAVGVGIAAAAGIAAFLLSSRKKRW
jgi:hypothetical protein